MPNTYTQIHLHAIFAVKNRASLIDSGWRGDLYRYVGGIIRNQGNKALAIGGIADHVHILFGLRAPHSVSYIMQHIKGAASFWVNQEKLTKGKFEWQSGYGAFSYAKSQIPVVTRYIENQEKHHQKRGFITEYKNILKKFDVEHDDKSIFYNVN